MSEPDKGILENSTNPSLAILQEQWRDVNRRIAALHFRWWAWILAVVGGFFILGFVGLLINPYHPKGAPDEYNVFTGSFALIGSVVVPAIYAIMMGIAKSYLESTKKEISHQIVKNNAEQLQENIEQDFFTKLVKINFKYLDQYYYQTQQQADKSFQLSVTAAVIGLFIVAIGITMLYFNKTQAAYVTTAAGVIGEFISAVFFYLYNRTIIKMSEYHQKLVLTQNINLALKITEELPDKEKAQSQQTLINHLVKDVNRYLAGSNQAYTWNSDTKGEKLMMQS